MFALLLDFDNFCHIRLMLQQHGTERFFQTPKIINKPRKLHIPGYQKKGVVLNAS